MQIEITGKTYNGIVTIYDRLTLPQVELVEEALFNEPPILKGKTGKATIKLTDVDKPCIPALIACVQKWELSNFPTNPTIDDFPLTPRREAHDLIMKIFEKVSKVYNGELEIPNE